MRLIIRSYGWPMHHGERTGVKCLRSGKLFHHTRPRNTSYQLPNKITHNTRCLQKRKTDWGEREYISVKKKKKKRWSRSLKKRKKKKRSVRSSVGVRRIKIKENKEGETRRLQSELGEWEQQVKKRTGKGAKPPRARNSTDAATRTPIILFLIPPLLSPSLYPSIHPLLPPPPPSLLGLLCIGLLTSQ